MKCALFTKAVHYWWYQNDNYTPPLTAFLQQNFLTKNREVDYVATIIVLLNYLLEGCFKELQV